MGRGKSYAIALALGVLLATPAAAQSAFTLSDDQMAVMGALSGDQVSTLAAEYENLNGALLYSATANNNKLPRFDWGMPQSPALALAGLGDTPVQTSRSLRAFAVSLPTTLGNDEQGQAIALDVSLSELTSPPESPTALYNYRNETYLNPGAATIAPDRFRSNSLSALEDSRGIREGGGESAYTRWLRRSRIGVVVYEGVDDSDDSKDIPARLAVGFSTSLWDESDPVAQNGPNGRPFLRECVPGLARNRLAQTLIAWGGGRLAPEQAQNGASLLLAQSLGLNPFGVDNVNMLAGETAQQHQDRMTVAAQSAFRANFAQLNAANIEASVAGVEQRLSADPVTRGLILQATEDCAQRASQIAELRRDLDVGVGLLYRGDPGQMSDFEERGAAAWVAFRFPWGVDLIAPDFGRELVSVADDASKGNADDTDPMANISQYWRLAGSARFSQDEYIATGDAGTPEIRVDQSEAWIGLERYSQNFRFGAFYGYSDVQAAEAAGQPFERSDERYVISAQYRLGRALGDEDSDLWIGITYGDAGSAANADNDDALMISFNFAPQPAYEIDWDPND